MSGRLLIILMWLGHLPMVNLFAQTSQNCESCHADVLPNCNLTCMHCHLSEKANFIPQKNHPPVIANPSRVNWWEEKCIQCHSDQIKNFQQDKHYSLSGIINQTRFLWGKDSILDEHNSTGLWKNLYDEIKPGHTPAELVDHLLAAKCMSCHFEADGRKNAVGQKRAGGCAACHSVFNQETGKPENGHRFVKKPVAKTCLTCHSPNYVGADYYGYFEHDYHSEYRTPFGTNPEFGAYQHRLAQDVHAAAGITCADCHSFNHGQRVNSKAVLQCTDCHGGFETRVANGKSKTTFDPSGISHQDFHSSLRCESCHAQWSYQDYGLHLFLDESKNFEMWENLIWQGDQDVTDLLQSQLVLNPEHRSAPLSQNRLTGESIPGIWYKGWTFRRWENPVLGIDEKGKYAIIRPLYQYYITYVDSAERVWLDSAVPKRADRKPGWIWDVYQPHTSGAKGRACESCHGNLKAAGEGIRSAAGDSVAHPITIPNEVIAPGTRLLNTKEKQNLLEKSEIYKKWRAKAFREEGIEDLFEK